MGRLPGRPAVSRSGWLALALSGAVHALLLGLLCCLPGERRHQDVALPMTCVRLADETPAPVVPPSPPKPAPAEPVRPRHEAITTIALPQEPVPTGPVATAAPGPSAEVRGEGGGSVGGPTPAPPATFFQAPVEGSRVVYVIDRSASMGLSDGLAAARRELLASLRQLPASARFQVVFYNRDADVLRLGGRSDLLPVTAENIDAAAAFLGRLRAEGGTDHAQALRRALALGPDVVFLVTDAADLSPEQVRAVTRCNGGRAVIHAIELGGHDTGGALQALARGNGGTYRCVAVTGAE